jgi:hypothetical protein
MSDEKKVQQKKPSVVKIHTPIKKPAPMPGGTAKIVRIQDSRDIKKLKN